MRTSVLIGWLALSFACVSPEAKTKPDSQEFDKQAMALITGWAADAHKEVAEGREPEGPAEYLTWCEWGQRLGSLAFELDRGQPASELVAETLRAARPFEDALTVAMRDGGYHEEIIWRVIIAQQATWELDVPKLRASLKDFPEFSKGRQEDDR